MFMCQLWVNSDILFLYAECDVIRISLSHGFVWIVCQPPPVVTVVLKVRMHCEACAQVIQKRIRKIKGTISLFLILIAPVNCVPLTQQTRFCINQSSVVRFFFLPLHLGIQLIQVVSVWFGLVWKYISGCVYYFPFHSSFISINVDIACLILHSKTINSDLVI